MAETSFATYVPGDLLAGKYLLEDIVGSGKFGVVFRARVKGKKGEKSEKGETGALCAVKIPRHSDDATESMKDEEKVLRRIVGAPGIVQWIESVVEPRGQRLALVLEWLGGGDMLQAICDMHRAKTRLAAPQLRSYCVQLIEALAALHAKGYSNADIKPQNVMRSACGAHVKLCDMGNALRVVENQLDEMPAVTSAYRAPELVLERAPFCPRTDLWSLACTLFEFATHHPLVDLDDDESDESSEGGEGDESESDGTSASVIDWKSASGSEGTSLDEEGECILNMRHLAQFTILFGHGFVPRSVRRQERVYYTSRGELRANKAFGLVKPASNSATVLDRVRLESGLGAADALAFADLPGRVLRYAPRDRLDCLALRSHAWIAEV